MNWKIFQWNELSSETQFLHLTGLREDDMDMADMCFYTMR